MISKWWLGTALLTVAACTTEDTLDEGSYDADPSDFDSKADGVTGTSQAVLDLIDGAKTRVYVQIGDLTDKKLLDKLRAAAARGVDVHAYLVVKTAAHPATVLASEQLEAAGVDITVEHTTKLAGFQIIADQKLLGGTDLVKTAAKFEAAIAEDTTGALPDVDSSNTALMIMPESHAAPIVKLVAAAKASIDLEIYQLQSPAVATALEAAQHRGVTVRVMLEPKTVGYANEKPMAARLAAAGITVKVTPPAFDSHRNVDHAKFMVIDGKELVMGSGNMVRSGLGGNSATEFDNRDFWLRDRRPAAVADAAALFDADWNRKTTSGFDNLVVTPDNASEKIGALIDGAKRRVFVYNQSLNDSNVIASLVAAKRRGVDTHVLLGMQPGFGGAPPANQPAIDELVAAGITADYLTAHYLHGKVVLADDAAFVGSQNFTSGGLGANRELGEITTSAKAVDALGKQFVADEAHKAP